MSRLFFLSFMITLLFLSACQATNAPACPQTTGTPHFLTVSQEALLTATSGPAPTSIPMEIQGRTITVDKVVEGPLCNDSWSGTVYVTCNVQVYPWVEQPTFLKNCNLSIAPGTVVYVAYHHDSAYYNGCSCHTGETATP